MSDYTLDVTVGADHVAVVEFARGPNNYFDTPFVFALAQAFEDLAAEGRARAILLCSSSKHFSAGANFTGPVDLDSEGPHAYDAAARMFAQPLPIVAAVHGAAIGGGLGLALVADVRYACPESRFGAPFARLGVHHGFGMSVSLPLVVGHQHALDLLYTARRINGEEALAIGLADACVPAAELRAASHAHAATIAANAPIAVQSMRKTMRGHLAELVRAATVREKSEQGAQQHTLDHKEGVAADLARRTPEFVGR
jgi:2-(1,2-epoxy-1,2-dihydrophenyl)acetyl-CoA isomerase